ncbi:hypothetical protein V4F87_003283 [Vibrio parahaemolyticus]|nr:hypothetical protein [Vibrio parahaemolyticus]
MKRQHNLNQSFIVYITKFTMLDGTNYYYAGKRVKYAYRKNYVGSGIKIKNLEYVSFEKIMEVEGDGHFAHRLEKDTIKVLRAQHGEYCLNIAEGGAGGQKGVKRKFRHLSDSHKQAISNTKRGMQYRKPLFEYYDELYALWTKHHEPKRGRFRTIAVANGYPDQNYHQIIEKFKTN